LTIPEDTINQIKERVNIVSLIGEYVHLKASGQNYKGLCPFHSEKTPSFTVSPQKGIFHCFGCNTGGNVFNFLMKFKGISFPDAVKVLGERVGIQIKDTAYHQKNRTNAEVIYTINRRAADIFQKNLYSGDGKGAFEYLKRRNFDADSLRSFQIGYARDGWDSLLNYLLKQGFQHKYIEESGLILKKKSGNGYYDRFRNRIIFPIQDSIERVIGFGARTIDETNPEIPKYVNTNENVLFHKGRTLYGISQAAESIRKNGSVYIVEGYFDVMRMHSAGKKNTVAPLGTALTEEQISIALRYTNSVYFIFDPDEAGTKATLRSISLIHRKGIDPAIIRLPSGKDPADFFDEYSVDDFDLLVEEAQPGTWFIVNCYADSKKKYTANKKITILKTLADYFNNMNDDIIKLEFLNYLAQVLSLEEGVLRRELNKFSLDYTAPRNNYKTYKNQEKISNRGVNVELYLLLLLLSNPELFPLAKSRLDSGHFHGKWTRRLWNAINKADDDNRKWDSGTIFDYLDDEKYVEYLSSKLIDEALNINPKHQLIDLISNLKEKNIKEKINDINQKLLTAELEHDENLSSKLIVEKQACRNELEKIKILRESKVNT
jgi:DNA primase